jgi:two-component system nitrate/nitrite sensor histidine kinase NarX
VGGVQVIASDNTMNRPRRVPTVLPESFLAAHPFHSVISTSAVLGDDWQCRVFLFDPHVGEPRSVRLRFLQTLMRQVGPAMHGVYLLRRLRSRAGATERARAARELHDGVIQSLFSAEMQLDVLRRRLAAGAVIAAPAVQQVQEVVRTEILNLRDLMLQMRPVDLKPRELLDYIASQVERFQHDTGIAATFISDLNEVSLPPKVCREVVRIVQEALVNVRKHSRAHRVVVRFSAQDGRWTLVFDDDGQGFRFTGRLSSAQLDEERKGPIVIKERVRALGGEIAIESTPGRGTRMEIMLPQTII